MQIHGDLHLVQFPCQVENGVSGWWFIASKFPLKCLVTFFKRIHHLVCTDTANVLIFCHVSHILNAVCDREVIPRPQKDGTVSWCQLPGATNIIMLTTACLFMEWSTFIMKWRTFHYKWHENGEHVYSCSTHIRSSMHTWDIPHNKSLVPSALLSSLALWDNTNNPEEPRPLYSLAILKLCNLTVIQTTTMYWAVPLTTSQAKERHGPLPPFMLQP